MPPEKLKLSRLVNALYLADHLGPDTFNWALHETRYSECSKMLMEEEGASHQRTDRENITLLVAAMMVVAEWMDVYPGRGLPNRAHVERLFKGAGLKEESVIMPLVQACAHEPVVVLTQKQKAEVRSASTLEGLEQVLAKLDSTPNHRNDTHYGTRRVPVSRGHVAAVLLPWVKRLRHLLMTEGRNPNDRALYNDLSDELDAWQM